jgi:hypothetical protein
VEEMATTRRFKRRLFGYSRRAVDAHLTDARGAYDAARQEIDRLKAAEPMVRAADDVSSLIASFADTVSTLRDSARRDADEIRREADEYAAAQRAEADQVAEQAAAKARSEAEGIVEAARAEITAFAEQRQLVQRALEEAAVGIGAALKAIGSLDTLAATEQPAAEPPAKTMNDALQALTRLAPPIDLTAPAPTPEHSSSPA